MAISLAAKVLETRSTDVLVHLQGNALAVRISPTALAVQSMDQDRMRLQAGDLIEVHVLGPGLAGVEVTNFTVITNKRRKAELREALATASALLVAVHAGLFGFTLRRFVYVHDFLALELRHIDGRVIDEQINSGDLADVIIGRHFPELKPPVQVEDLV